MPLTSRSVAGGPVPRGVWFLPPTAGYALAVQWPLSRSGEVALLAVDVLVAVAFVATGVFVGADPEHRATGRALWCAGAVWPLNWVDEWQIGPLPLVAALVGPLGSVLAAWALLRYPVRRPGRGGDRVVAAVLAAVQAAAVVVVVVSCPEWHGLDAGSPWLALWPSWSVFRAATAAYDIGGAVVAAAVPVCLLLRFRRLRGLDRRAMRPVVRAVVLAAALTALVDLDAASALPETAQYEVCVVQTLALAGIPLAFLGAVVGRWLALRHLPALATALRATRTAGEVQAVLRTALGDPALTVLLAGTAQPGSWIDVDGRPAVADERGRHVVELVSADGERLGLVLGDAALRRHRTLVDPIVRTAARAVESARLQSLVLARIAETRDCAARLAAVLAVEERRLVDDLRSGPLRHLDTARGLLDGQASSGLESVRDLARRAGAELARLATGDPPTALADRGLAAVFADRAPVPGPATLVASFPPGRFPPQVEVATYFAVTELVTNAAKHAGAAGIRVEGHVADGALVVRVRDDGRGGADPDGSGIAGVRERLRAIGGDLRLRSPAGRGTDALLTLPLHVVPTPGERPASDVDPRRPVPGPARGLWSGAAADAGRHGAPPAAAVHAARP